MSKRNPTDAVFELFGAGAKPLSAPVPEPKPILVQTPAPAKIETKAERSLEPPKSEKNNAKQEEKPPIQQYGNTAIRQAEKTSKEKVKGTFMFDAQLWEDFVILLEIKGKKQVEFLTDYIKKEVEQNQQPIKRAKELKAQLKGLTK